MEVTVIMFEGVPELYNSVTHTRIPAISSLDGMCSQPVGCVSQDGDVNWELDFQYAQGAGSLAKPHPHMRVWYQVAQEFTQCS